MKWNTIGGNLLREPRMQNKYAWTQRANEEASRKIKAQNSCPDHIHIIIIAPFTGRVN
jgi:REP element-mobilizing transposase RayT